MKKQEKIKKQKKKIKAKVIAEIFGLDTKKRKTAKKQGCHECWKTAQEKGMVALYELVCKKGE